ncbi:ThiF family adenylyltransferase [Streptomyces triticagri]|uniref:ThiF family adenylyltransferase n=1 Tax=Streptomyces triticagri TaxID=2293568 RepID=A0A372LX82_9ACTN|nr:ThiF family adenylyltransferase [Streptomyces triticagri]RFU83256.1 ThiF family adenylyltransferase [Streptomyces triticagri]
MAETIRLLDSVDATTCAGGMLLSQGPRALRARGPKTWLERAVAEFRDGVAVPAPDDRGAFARLVGALRQQGWVTSEPVAGPELDGLPHQRQVGYLGLFGDAPARMQRRLSAARVAVIGVGGIGALLAQQLVAAGVRHLWLVDHDEVEAHNLNRQHLYVRADIGVPKVAAAATRLAATAPDVVVTGVRRRITTSDDLADLPQDLDLVVVAADSPADIAGICWAWAALAQVPVAMAAVGLDTGYWGPLLVPSMGHCWWCFDTERRSRLSADEGRMEATVHAPTPYSFGPSNATIAALLSHDVLRFLASGQALTLGARGHLRFDTGSTTIFRGPEACGCPPGPHRQPSGHPSV